MIELTKAELIRVVSGTERAQSDSGAFRGVEYDTRRIKGGELFVALKGEREHGHAYVAQALSSGAAMALVEDHTFFNDSQIAERIVCVTDTYRALSALGSYWRRQVNAQVCGITGSLGKTATKEMVARILETLGAGTWAQKSFNNNIGVPYTICGARREDRWMVLEMGMNHPGELHELSLMAAPDVVTLTCVAPVHVEFFPSLAQVADAKAEIIDGLERGGEIVANGDDSEVRAALKRRGRDREVKWFGTGTGSWLRVSDVQSRGLEGISFELHSGNERTHVSMKLLGTHNAMNAAAAAATAKALFPELSLSTIGQALASAGPAAMRLNAVSLKGGKTLIDDSYNASPVAVRASLQLVADLRRDGLRVGAILGDMLELGDSAKAYHREVGEFAASAKLDFLIAVGALSRETAEAAKAKGMKVVLADSPEAAARIALAENFDLLLVKGSRGMKLEKAVQDLKNELQ